MQVIIRAITWLFPTSRGIRFTRNKERSVGWHRLSRQPSKTVMEQRSGIKKTRDGAHIPRRPRARRLETFLSSRWTGRRALLQTSMIWRPRSSSPGDTGGERLGTTAAMSCWVMVCVRLLCFLSASSLISLLFILPSSYDILTFFFCSLSQT